jgi:hypothetical protein
MMLRGKNINKEKKKENSEIKDDCGNIHFLLEEKIDETNIEDIDINEIMKQIDSYENYTEELVLPQIIHYNENFTVKELFFICDYYGFLKDIKTNKCNKEQIIEILVNFENNPTNSEIVFKRQTMWFYMNELKRDKFMKKYLLW